MTCLLDLCYHVNRAFTNRDRVDVRRHPAGAGRRTRRPHSFQSSRTPAPAPTGAVHSTFRRSPFQEPEEFRAGSESM
jgi:hypothetical protein